MGALWRRYCPPPSQRLTETHTQKLRESDRDREIRGEAERQWQSLGDRKSGAQRQEGIVTKIHAETETRAVTKTQRAERKSDGGLRDGKRVRKSYRAVKKPRNKETG